MLKQRPREAGNQRHGCFHAYVYVAQYMLIFVRFLRMHVCSYRIVSVCNKTGRDM